VLPPRRQNLLFSATFSDEIRRLADGLLDNPAAVQVTPRNTPTELVTQVVHMVDRERKRELLSHLIKTGRIDQALVFTRTKHGANRLAQQLERDGILATAIHGNKSQPQRVRALADFKAGRFAVLVATEVAARGLDIEALPHVVNFELPMVPEDYVHRIGRTGRAGVDGDAVSLVCVDELKLLNDIERVLGRGIPRETISGFEPDPRIRPEPILRGGLGGTRPSRSMSGAGAPRHVGAPRHAAGPRPVGTGRPVGAPRPGGGPNEAAIARHGAGPRPAAGPRPGGPRPGGPRPAGSRPGGSRPGNRGAGFAGPRRPGQGIGNGSGPRPASGGQRSGPRSGGDGPSRSDSRGGYGQPRPTNPGTMMPGERISGPGRPPRG
jgi:ATP-dependent RNA helicase RhlE